jgi:hypothetical protein
VLLQKKKLMSRKNGTNAVIPSIAMSRSALKPLSQEDAQKGNE